MKKQPVILVKDYELWSQLLQGNKEVIEELYRRYYNQLFSYGLTVCYDKELVRDCIQDLFVKLFCSNNLKPTQYVRAYLMKAIRNLIYDKATALEKDLSLSHDHLLIGADDESLNRLFSKNDADVQRSKKLLEIFKSLSGQQQNVIMLRFVQSLSYKEIAVVMGINTQSCMNLVTRALQKFRKEIN